LARFFQNRLFPPKTLIPPNIHALFRFFKNHVFGGMQKTIFVMAVLEGGTAGSARQRRTSVCGNLTADKVVVWFFGESMFGRMAAVVPGSSLFPNTRVHNGCKILTIRR
jgi:hypothetical protein